MSHDARLPAMIWHLAHAANWAAALGRGSYAISTRGATLEQVGFVHASFGQQVERVAELFYADDGAPLTLLGIDTGLLANAGIDVRSEPGDPSHPEGERFPHIYGAVPTACVTEIHAARMVDGALLAPTWRAAQRSDASSG